MLRIVTLVSTPAYQNSVYGLDGWRDTIYQAFSNDGWQIVSLNVSHSVFSGGYITIVANVNNAYSDAFTVTKANQILESITNSFGLPVFSNANFKVLSNTNSAITTTTDTTLAQQDDNKVFGSSTVLIAAAVAIVFLLRK